jgi:putative hemolysin
MGAMKRPMRAVTRVAGAALLLLSVTAAVRPTVFMQTGGGLWEVSRSNGGRRTVCVPDPAALAQYEHLRASCARDLVRNQQSRAEIHYTCAGGAFGQSTVELITPRSLRIETQGISDNAPFHYVLQARRLGNC